MAASSRFQDCSKRRTRRSGACRTAQKLQRSAPDGSRSRDARGAIPRASGASMNCSSDWTNLDDGNDSTWLGELVRHRSAGLQLARSPESPTDRRSTTRWRTYFHGGHDDTTRRLAAGPDRITSRRPTCRACSAARPATAGSSRSSTPVSRSGRSAEFPGRRGMAVEVGRFVELQSPARQFAVLVDWRTGRTRA